MSRLPIVILGLLLALTLAFAAAACGDDDGGGDGNGGSPTGGGGDAEAYYQDVDRIQNELTRYLNDVQEQSDAAYGDPDKATSSLSAAKTAGEEALADLEALTPPSVANDPHNDLVSASQEFLDAVEAAITELEGIEGPGQEYSDFLGGILQPDSDFSTAQETLRDACAGMQQAANNSRVDIVFQCPV